MSRWWRLPKCTVLPHNLLVVTLGLERPQANRDDACSCSYIMSVNDVSGMHDDAASYVVSCCALLTVGRSGRERPPAELLDRASDVA